MAQSARSATSSRSAYRVVSSGSAVDETLFAKMKNQAPQPIKKVVYVSGKDTVMVRKPISALKGQSTQQGDALMIASSDFNRLRETSKKTEKEIAEDRHSRSVSEYHERQVVSLERKERMKGLEEERRHNEPLSEMEQVDIQQRNAVLARARQSLDEGIEEVKHMNQLVMKSKVAAIRDVQLQEKAFMNQQKEEEAHQAELVMEVERLKALKMYEEREAKRLEDQRKGAQVIVDQLHAREHQRQREQDLKDQERIFVLKQIEALRLEEIEQAKARKLAAAKLMDEVNAINQAAYTIKEEAMLQNKLEDQKILEYIRRRDEQERVRDEEVTAEKARKEAEVARLRAKQQRAQDRQSEIDALRAKRAIEAGERAARLKAARESQRLAAMNAELAEARRVQREEKEQKLIEQAILEKHEFDRTITVQKQQEDAERMRNEERLRVMKHHSNELRSQIHVREEKALQDRRDSLEEGNIIRAQTMLEKRKLLSIKQRKLDELKRAGIPDKYTTELAKITV